MAHPAWGVEECARMLGRAPVQCEWRAWVGGVAEALAASAGVRARRGGVVRKWRFRHHGQHEGNFVLSGCVANVRGLCVCIEGSGPSIPLALPYTTTCHSHIPRLTRRAQRSATRSRRLLAGASDPGTGALLRPVRFRQLGTAAWEVVLECEGTSTHALVPKGSAARDSGKLLPLQAALENYGACPRSTQPNRLLTPTQPWPPVLTHRYTHLQWQPLPTAKLTSQLLESLESTSWHMQCH